MIYKVLLMDTNLRCLNDAHKLVHSVMHKPDEHLPCPPFTVDGEVIRIQSGRKPIRDGILCVEFSPDNFTIAHLRVRLPAIRRHHGVDKAVLVDNRIDAKYMAKYVIDAYARFGLTPLDTPKVTYYGKINDPEHKIGKYPVCEIDGNWEISDSKQFENLLLSKIGRLSFLGMGMTRVVDD